MSADNLDIINASLRVVRSLSNLSNDLCIFLTQIIDEQPDDEQSEADDLLDKLQGLGALVFEIARLLRARSEDRENVIEVTSDELAAEKWLCSVLRRCAIGLREMKREFNPLQNTTGDVSIDLDTNIDFEKQQKRVEWQHRTISAALQLLDSHRSRAERMQLARLLQELRNRPPEGPPSGPISPQHEAAEVDTPLDQSGETGMPEPDDQFEGVSGADDGSIDVFISGAGSPSFGCTGAPSEEVVLSNTLMSIVKMASPLTQISEVKQLLRTSSPEEIRARDDDDWTLLHHAVLQENVPLLKLLLRQSAIRDPSYLDAVDSSGHTALMEASRRADHERGSVMAHLLLEVGCEVNVVDSSPQKRSALYFVVERPSNKHSTSVARALLQKDADVSHIAKIFSKKKTGYTDVHKVVEAYNRRPREGSGSSRDKFDINTIPP